MRSWRTPRGQRRMTSTRMPPSGAAGAWARLVRVRDARATLAQGAWQGPGGGGGGGGGGRGVAARGGEHAAPEVGRVDHVDEHVGLGAGGGRVQPRQRVRQSILLAREPLDEVAADGLTAVLHPEQRVAE